jgi:hypothetical protein
MRKRLAILLALSLTAIMTLGVIGSSAAFSYQSNFGSQQFTVGAMTLKITALTPSAVTHADGTVTCAPVLITTDHGKDSTCKFLLQSVGEIAPASVKINVSESGLTAQQITDKHFWVYPNNGAAVAVTGTPQQLYPDNDPIVPIPAAGVTIDPETSWGGPVGAPAQYYLGNDDMGTVVTMTYQIVASS